MSEFIHSPEQERVATELRSVLASYTIGVIMKASTEGFTQDFWEASGYIQEHTHYATGKAITEADVQAIAASSVLIQMVESFSEEKPIILSPDVPGALDIYHSAQAVIDEVGLTPVRSNLEIRTMVNTVRRISGKTVPTNPSIEAAVEVWNRRGTIMMEMESIHDILEAAAQQDHSTEAPDTYYEEQGMQIEEYSLSRLEVPSKIEELPYYAQFYEVEHGLQWLTSLLEDLKAIHRSTY